MSVGSASVIGDKRIQPRNSENERTMSLGGREREEGVFRVEMEAPERATIRTKTAEIV